ncbi:MAG: asparaginase [Rhodospirillales bacterium]|nr:asparaginase [Rhodospirillales bacterium]
MNLSESLLVEVFRGSMVESVHHIDAVVVTADGDIVAAWGDVEYEVYARSSAKPLQALPLIETGAADHFGFTDTEIALACASHQGQPIHVNGAAAIMERIGLGEDDFECGAHWPYDLKTAGDLARAGEKPTRFHNNCSGKHSGFLTTAVHMGEPTAGYIQPDHAVQQRITEAMSEMTGWDLSTTARGVDGCGIPVIGMPLAALARGMARMADPRGMGAVRENAAQRIVAAMSANPEMVGGRGKVDTAVMAALDSVALKGGAEGVHIAILPEKGMGVAMKTRDGSGRASDAAILWVLKYLGVIGERALEELADHLEPPIKNTLGNTVGHIATRESGGGGR